jgi:hypothetical protein
MIPEDKRVRRLGPYETKNLRGLAVKTVAELNIRWDRILPPIVFHSPVGANVAHVENLPDA